LRDGGRHGRHGDLTERHRADRPPHLDGCAPLPSSLPLDIYDTDYLAHGGQQRALFNAHAGSHCFQPIPILGANAGKPILSLLREGKRPFDIEIARLLWHLIPRVHWRWQRVRVLIRGDGRCSSKALNLQCRLRCDYMLGLSTNPKIEVISKPWCAPCDMRRKPSRPKVRRVHRYKK
jgi:hypothetical protein